MKQRHKPWLVLGDKPELEGPVIEVTDDEDGRRRTTYVGRRYLCGNYVVTEYADPLFAAEAYAEAVELDELASRG